MNKFKIGTRVEWVNRYGAQEQYMTGEVAAIVKAGGDLRKAWRATVARRNVRDRRGLSAATVKEDTYLVIVPPATGRGKSKLYIRPAKTLTLVTPEPRG